MNILKRIFCVVSVAAVLAASFSGCAKKPDYEATTGTENVVLNSVVYPETDGVKPEESASSGSEIYTLDNYQQDDSQTTSVVRSNVNFLTKSYYVYSDNYASIEDISFDENDITYNASGFLKVKVIYIGSRSDNIRIGYRAYDKDGNVIRDSFILVKLDEVRADDIISDIRFDIPYESVKVVFFDYNPS